MAVIWCLHGFLGRGADWDFLRDAGFDIRAPSLFAGETLDSVRPASDDVLLGQLRAIQACASDPACVGYLTGLIHLERGDIASAISLLRKSC